MCETALRLSEVFKHWWEKPLPRQAYQPTVQESASQRAPVVLFLETNSNAGFIAGFGGKKEKSSENPRFPFNIAASEEHFFVRLTKWLQTHPFLRV